MKDLKPKIDWNTIIEHPAPLGAEYTESLSIIISVILFINLIWLIMDHIPQIIGV